MVLKGQAARIAIHQLQEADPEEAQLILAKLTGNFKRGNERNAQHVRARKGSKG